MRLLSFVLTLFVLAFTAWTLLAAAPAAPRPSWSAVAAAAPSFLQQGLGGALPLAPAGGGPAQVQLPSSVIPPGPPVGGQCSALAANAACSVLPSSLPPAGPAACSVFATVASHICSAVGLARRQLCSTKGVGSPLCSVIQNPDVCSVVNVGAPDRSFCSTKFNQPMQAKAYSTFPVNSECSAAGSDARRLGAGPRSGGSVPSQSAPLRAGR